MRERLAEVSWTMVLSFFFAALGAVAAFFAVVVHRGDDGIGLAAVTCALLAISFSIASFREDAPRPKV